MSAQKDWFARPSEEELAALDDEEIEQLIDDHEARVIFVRDAMPDAWLDQAEELMDAAEVLWEQKDQGLRVEAVGTGDNNVAEEGIRLTEEPRKISAVSRPYILLAGFALENLIKGLLVAQDPTHINRGQLSSDLKSHRLLALASKVDGLSLNERERRACRVLEDAIPYWGRYPIPLKYNKVLPEVAVDNRLRHVLVNLHFRLAKRLHWMIRDGWDSRVGARICKRRNGEYGDPMDLSESLFE